MSYTNINNLIVKPSEDYIRDNWTQAGGYLPSQVYARGAHLCLVPISLVTSTLDTAVGVVAGIGAICTVGKHGGTYQLARNHLGSSHQLLALPYKNLLRTINPEADFPKAADIALCRSFHLPAARICSDGDGFLSSFVINRLNVRAEEYYKSNSLLKQHVASRLTYVLLAVACIITRVADAIIGLIAACFSLLTCGKFETINNLAYRALQAPGLIDDLFYCTIKVINPWTGVKSPILHQNPPDEENYHYPEVKDPTEKNWPKWDPENPPEFD